jgi:two-component system, chemotaxis family, sensor kinase CheA
MSQSDADRARLDALSAEAEIDTPGPASTVAQLAVAAASALSAADSAPAQVLASRDWPRPGSVAVDGTRLDQLIDSVGGLVAVQHRIAALLEKARAGASQQELVLDVQRLQRSCERQVDAVRACALDVRRVRLLPVLDALARLTKSLAGARSNSLHVVVDEAEIELDKTIADGIVEPLALFLRHLVLRVLEPDQQATAGAAPSLVTLALRARAHAGQVAIELHVTGRDLQLATDSGQLAQLRTHARCLGGTVELSHAAAGCSVTLTVPVTLSVIGALLISIGATNMALPLSGVVEVVRYDERALQLRRGRPFIDVRGVALQLASMSEVLCLPRAGETRRYQHVVVINSGTRRLGLLIDQALGQRPLMLKPLGWSLRGVSIFAGAADLGEGRLVLVLDPTGLIDEQEQAEDAGLRATVPW